MEKYPIRNKTNFKLMVKHGYEVVSYFVEGVIFAKGGHRVLWDTQNDEEKFSYIVNKPKE